MVRKQTPWLAANLVYAGVLVALGMVPDLPPFGKDVPDDLPHGAAYALQAVLLYCLVKTRLGAAAGAVSAAAGATKFGGFVEILQLLQPARTFEGEDVLANAVGAGAGVAATYLWMPRGRKSGLQ
jgi:VanZ family protein